MKYFAKIKYLGTAFHGFQVQPNKRTVQGELCYALEQTFGEPCKVTGCSRTDAGVHANEFCLSIETEAAYIPPQKLPLAAARFLPPDISLFYAEVCEPNFHPRYDVISKEYLYRIVNSRVADPFEIGRSWFLPRIIDEAGLERMRESAKELLGRHDFTSFMSEGSDTVDTVREVYYISISKNGDIIDLKISANGFLYNMVRIIVGTLVESAFGKFSPEKIRKILESRDRRLAGMTVPPDGLYLNKVNY